MGSARCVSHLPAPGLPLAPETDPKRECNQAYIKPKGLFADIEEIVAELVVLVGKEKWNRPFYLYLAIGPI
ncbi:MAG TPA: hypothetical protein VMW42_12725 [Desulfatiglandales bacterium]|nr:hypothetical protein [Desulfatiglandales bacterium]